MDVPTKVLHAEVDTRGTLKTELKQGVQSL